MKHPAGLSNTQQQKDVSADENRRLIRPRPLWAYPVGAIGLLFVAFALLVVAGFLIAGGDAILVLILMSPFLVGIAGAGVILLWLSFRARNSR